MAGDLYIASICCKDGGSTCHAVIDIASAKNALLMYRSGVYLFTSVLPNGLVGRLKGAMSSIDRNDQGLLLRQNSQPNEGADYPQL
ncbi:hypothetical protein M514_05798 [Trichuris suis]|uniref:Uncharacterized protein n=1 Tax=Trichuris suis TaxID=68888 RepID=A0A085M7X1_9BILA|nr:hypothetical protein M513_05798 [Trichuris suis]KFD66408.1 hypothetical protein M514_05798 [Trichuris suis]